MARLGCATAMKAVGRISAGLGGVPFAAERQTLSTTGSITSEWDKVRSKVVVLHESSEVNINRGSPGSNVKTERALDGLVQWSNGEEALDQKDEETYIRIKLLDIAVNKERRQGIERIN